MKTKILLISMFFFFIYSCDFRKSVNKDLITGLTTMGNGLSCEDVSVSKVKEKIVVEKLLITYGGKQNSVNLTILRALLKQEILAFRECN